MELSAKHLSLCITLIYTREHFWGTLNNIDSMIYLVHVYQLLSS